jgi:glycine/D-amino acid oxidase-like deaminating enzyme
MNVEHEHSQSIWMDIPSPEFPALAEDAETEVLVIGGGIAGLSSAYELALAGRKVMVVDRGRLARGMTARTSAHLSFEIDDTFRALAKGSGQDAARRWYESQSAAVDRIEAICRDEGIDCDFARVDGLLVPARARDVVDLRKELEAAHDAGFSDAEWLEAGARPDLDTAAIRFPRQARFHPVKYLNGLIEALQRRGAKLYGYTDVTELEARGSVLATTGEKSTIRARQVVVATNTPFHLKIPIHTKQAPYRTYVIAAPVPGARSPTCCCGTPRSRPTTMCASSQGRPRTCCWWAARTTRAARRTTGRNVSPGSRPGPGRAIRRWARSPGPGRARCMSRRTSSASSAAARSTRGSISAPATAARA